MGKLHRRQQRRKFFGINFGILKIRFSCLENELSKEDTIIDFLSKQLTARKRNIFPRNDFSSSSVNGKESNTIGNSLTIQLPRP